MSFCEMNDHKILNLFKIKQREFDLFKQSWDKGYVSRCNKHSDYYQRHFYRLRTYLEKRGYPFDNDKNIIGSFNENTKEVIKKWKLDDGQGVCAYFDFEKGLIYIGDIL